MSPKEMAPVEAVRAAVAALNARDLDGYRQAFTNDCTRTVQGLPEPLPIDDAVAGLGMFVDAVDNFRLDELVLFGEGRHVCARWQMRGLHVREYVGLEPTGREVCFESAEIYEFETEDGGLVRASWSYGDINSMLEQMTGGTQ